MDTPETGLVRAGSRALITSQSEYERQLQVWQKEDVHALCPMIDFGALPEQFVLVPAKVQINPDINAGEVYKAHFCKPGEVALTTMGLQKIASCAGISLDTQRTDPRTIPLYWEFKAMASWTGFDGATQRRAATKEWDLRNGSEQLKGFTANQISEARKHGSRNAETRAINAVIRQLGIKQKYTVDELRKPFGLVRVVYQPNMSDPVQRAIVTQQAIGGGAAFYGPPALGAGQGPVIEGQLADAHEEPAAAAASDRSTVETPAASAASPTSDFEEIAPAPTSAPEATRYRIVKAAFQKREAEQLGPLYFFTTEPAGVFVTENAGIAREGAEAKKADALVEIDAEARGDERWIVELRRVDPTSPAAAAAPAGTCFVEKVDDKTGVKQTPGKPDRPWTRYTITFSTGETGTTFSKTIGDAAIEARDKRLPVKRTLEDNPAYPDQQNLTALTIVDPNQPSFLTSEL